MGELNGELGFFRGDFKGDWGFFMGDFKGELGFTMRRDRRTWKYKRRGWRHNPDLGLLKDYREGGRGRWWRKNADLGFKKEHENTKGNRDG